ncbi:MAG: ABC transporter ATP-binding protein [Pseudomonadota bacterium]
MSAALIESHALTLVAAGRTLVHALDWRAAIGERWCVIGRNAAGKSSLLRALAGIGDAALQRAGEVRWLGRATDAWPASDAASVRAFLPQQTSDRFPITVRRLLELSLVQARHDPHALLLALDAAALPERNVLELSGGERQRVALAQCAVQGAPLLLLDEPVAFQDPAHQLQVAQWLGTLAQDHALVISAHDVNWIAGAATHVLALLPDGRCEQGTAAEMLVADRLERVYGCAWRAVNGDGAPVWVAH